VAAAAAGAATAAATTRRAAAATGEPVAMAAQPLAADMTYAPPASDLDVYRTRALVAGVAGLVVCAIGVVVAPDHFFRSWLIAYLLALGVALGSIALTMIQHLSGGTWGVFRRIFEASSRTLPLLLVLFVPVVIGMTTLYPWTHADHVQTDAVLRHKAPYLNTAFFLVRAGIYFLSWIGLALVLNRLSARQDTGDVGVNTTLQRWSGAGLVIYALTVTFAGVDWIMSINPHWYSTLFGFLMIGGQGLAALAFTIVASTYLVRREPMATLLRPHHFHDLGKLMLAFVMLWAYFNVSQLLIIWSANLPEEIPHYLTRWDHGWQWVSLAIIVLHFILPYSLLLSRDLKRNPARLKLVAIWIICMRVVDYYWHVAPEFQREGLSLSLLDVALPLALGGIFITVFVSQLRGRALLPVHDAGLEKALAHHVH